MRNGLSVLVLVLVIVASSTQTACSTTDEYPSEPWQDAMMNEVCDDANADIADCSR
jgi:hypothetical protein